MDTRTERSSYLRQRSRIVVALQSIVAALLASRRLARETRRYKTRGSPIVPDTLRRDIGLAPHDARRTHWDYR